MMMLSPKTMPTMKATALVKRVCLLIAMRLMTLEINFVIQVDDFRNQLLV
jgi:hypothetical protein